MHGCSKRYYGPCRCTVSVSYTVTATVTLPEVVRTAFEVKHKTLEGLLALVVAQRHAPQPAPRTVKAEAEAATCFCCKEGVGLVEAAVGSDLVLPVRVGANNQTRVATDLEVRCWRVGPHVAHLIAAAGLGAGGGPGLLLCLETGSL